MAHATTKSIAEVTTLQSLQSHAESTGSNAIQSDTALVSSLHTLQEAANKACIIDKNPAECSRTSQELGAQSAIANGPQGPAVRALDALKSRGSVDSYFYYPTWVQAIKPTNPSTAAVALSLAGLNKP